MSDQHWNTDYAKSLAIFLSGDGIHSRDEKGREVVDDNFYLMFNAGSNKVTFKLPTSEYGSAWQKIVDSHQGMVLKNPRKKFPAENRLQVQGRSVLLLICRR